MKSQLPLLLRRPTPSSQVSWGHFCTTARTKSYEGSELGRRGEKSQFQTKSSLGPTRPGPVGASPPAHLRERGTGQPRTRRQGRGVGLTAVARTTVVTAPVPDPLLRPARRLWPGKCRWQRETSESVGLASSAKGRSRHGTPSSAARPQQDPRGTRWAGKLLLSKDPAVGARA